MQLSPSLPLSIGIECPLDAAYDFLSRPENFPRWASGLAGSLEHVDGRWFADTVQGRIQIRFSERNAFGVLDHWVDLPAGGSIYIPLRVIANGDGCELTLTLFRQPDMTDEKLAADAEWVRKDLAAAKRLLESG